MLEEIVGRLGGLFDEGSPVVCVVWVETEVFLELVDVRLAHFEVQVVHVRDNFALIFVVEPAPNFDCLSKLVEEWDVASHKGLSGKEDEVDGECNDEDGALSPICVRTHRVN